MKILATILSFILLFFSTVPCSAYAECSACGVEKSCVNDSDCGKDCNGKCSPFHSCSTCIGFTMNVTTVTFSEKLDFISDEIAQSLSYDNFVYSSFICKIWQPPKIS